MVNRAFNVTPTGGNKMIHCEIFAQTGFLLKVQLKLMLQQLFTLHWYRRDYSTCQHGRQIEFSRGWGNNEFFQGVAEKFFLGGANSGEI